MKNIKFEEKVKYFKENYREYVDLLIAMELGLDCQYFHLSEEERDNLYYVYMKSDYGVIDVESLREFFC